MAQRVKVASLMTRVSPSGPTKRDRIKFHKWSSDLHMCTGKHMLTQTPHLHWKACAHTNPTLVLGNMHSHKNKR